MFFSLSGYKTTANINRGETRSKCHLGEELVTHLLELLVVTRLLYKVQDGLGELAVNQRITHPHYWLTD